MTAKKVNSKTMDPGIVIDSLTPALGVIEEVIEWCAERSGIKGLPHVVPVIQTNGKERFCNGHFLPTAWSDREGVVAAEMSFSAEKLSRPPLKILATIVHECEHFNNAWRRVLPETDAAYQKPDTSKSGRHNTIFKSNAETAGLVVTVTEDGKAPDSYGFGYTTASVELDAELTARFQDQFPLLRLFKLTLPPKEKKETKNKKYICGGEGCADGKPMSFRTGLPPAIVLKLVGECSNCDTAFRLDDSAI